MPLRRARSGGSRRHRCVELVAQQRLEARSATTAHLRAALGQVDPGSRDRNRVVGHRVRQLLAVPVVGDPLKHHGVDVELEAEREHWATVARPGRAEQQGETVHYASGEDGAVAGAEGSR